MSASDASNSPRVTLAGSHRDPVAGATPSDHLQPDTPIELTIALRPRDGETLARRGQEPGASRYTHDEYIRAHAPTQENLDTVRGFLEAHNFSVTAVAPDRSTVTATGRTADAERAFGASLAGYRQDDATFHARSGAISVPADVAPLIAGVFGLDTRPVFRPRSVPLDPEAASPPGLSPLSPLDVARAYGFPDGDGTGQTVAILELGGGYLDADVQQAATAAGTAVPTIIVVPVDGGGNNPGVDSGADGEVSLDIEIVATVAPAARIAVYFAPDASERSFVDVVTAVVNDSANNPSVLSISWGGPEGQSTADARGVLDTAFQKAAGLGITVLAASGDNGSADAPGGTTAMVDYPAASPSVTGCGGTTLALTNGSPAGETVWNEPGHGATGGGLSAVYPVPAWQQGVTLPPRAGGGGPPAGRGVPDVAGNADPFSGYLVTINGQTTPIGGTSAVAPLWAGLIARINGRDGKRAGFLNPTLYAASGRGCRDITTGTNAVAPAPGYSAAAGWDACTGWGSPDGAQLDSLLSQSPLA